MFVDTYMETSHGLSDKNSIFEKKRIYLKSKEIDNTKNKKYIENT